jgi:S1-C subfamily serine protease
MNKLTATLIFLATISQTIGCVSMMLNGRPGTYPARHSSEEQKIFKSIEASVRKSVVSFKIVGIDSKVSDIVIETCLGVFVSPRIIVTAAHCLKDIPQNIKRCQNICRVVISSDDTTLDFTEFEVVATFIEEDLAFLRAPFEQAYLNLAAEKSSEKAPLVVFGRHTTEPNSAPKILIPARALASHTDKIYAEGDFVRGGNSGGPIVNEKGELEGILCGLFIPIFSEDEDCAQCRRHGPSVGIIRKLFPS